MGREGAKFSYVHTPLNRPRPDGTFDTTLSDTGPGMTAPTLRACGWLDLPSNGIDISDRLETGTRRATFSWLRCAVPRTGAVGTVCAFADGVVPGQRLLVEYRSRDGWDQGMPQRGAGWVVAHFTGPEDRSPHVPADRRGRRRRRRFGGDQQGGGRARGRRGVGVRRDPYRRSHGAGAGRPELRLPSPVGAATASTSSLAASTRRAFHKAWAQTWYPSQDGWEAIGGGFTSPLAVESWGPDRLDIFGVGLDKAMWHKAWAQAWHPERRRLGADRRRVHSARQRSLHGVRTGSTSSRSGSTGSVAQGLGAALVSVTDRLGSDSAASSSIRRRWPHGVPSGSTSSASASTRQCSTRHGPTAGIRRPAWEFLGGGFTSPPAVCSWGPDRLDIFALGLDGSHVAQGLGAGMVPRRRDWEPLGGKFLSPPAVASWAAGPDRHLRCRSRRRDVPQGVGRWLVALTDGWESLGGTFSSPPAVVSWAPDRLDIFALGKDFGMWHKAWAQQWHPSTTGWEPLNGSFL